MKNQNSEPDFLQKFINFINYFPVRFFALGFFFSFIFLTQFKSIKFFEEQCLLSLFQFFQIPSFFTDGVIYLGGFYAPIDASAPLYSQILYLIFFPALAVSTKASIDMKIKIALWGIVCFFSMIGVQFVTDVVVFITGIGPYVSLSQINFMIAALVGAAVIEISLFSVLTLPKRTKFRPMIQRKGAAEYVYFVLFLVGTFIVMYFMVNLFRITTDSPVAAYVGLNITTLMAFRFYLAFFVAESKLPDWLQQFSSANQSSPNSISVIIPCYNEEKTIQRCIKSADIAASKFGGRTEIIVVNDGSTDRSKQFIEEAMKNLRYATGKFFNISNSGKGVALKIALTNASGEIILRLDADSMVDKNIIEPVMRHFRDPNVASVSGMIFPIEEKSFWQKAQILVGVSFLFYKRGQEVVNTILCQPGSFSVFKRDTLIKVGGWADDQFGEDAEITIRLTRCGYKNEFEQDARIISEAPETFKEFRTQRLRWNLGYYNARAKNMDFLKALTQPGAFIYLFSVISHGVGFALGLYWAYFIALILTNPSVLAFGTIDAITGLPIQLGIVEGFFFALHLVLYGYFLARFKKLHYIKYLPFLRAFNLIQSLILRPEALEIILNWSSKWKEHTRESYNQLRKDMMKNK